jgi:hypothetical protein
MDISAAKQHVYRERQLMVHLIRAEVFAASSLSNPSVLVQKPKAMSQLLTVAGLPPSEVEERSLSKTESEEQAFKQYTLSRFNESGDPFGTERAHFGAFGQERPLQPRVTGESEEKIQQAHPPQEPKFLVDAIVGYEERISALFGVPRSFFAQFSASKSANSPDGREMWHNAQRSLKQMVSLYVELVFEHIYTRLSGEVSALLVIVFGLLCLIPLFTDAYLSNRSHFPWCATGRGLADHVVTRCAEVRGI